MTHTQTQPISQLKKESLQAKFNQVAENNIIHDYLGFLGVTHIE